MKLFKSYPSGKVSASVIRKINLSPVMEAKDLSEDAQFNLRQVELHGIERVREVVSKLATRDKPMEPKPKRVSRGSAGISSRGQQLVKDGCFVLERDYGKDQLVFFTGTIAPGVPLLTNFDRKEWGRRLNLWKRRIIRRLSEANLATHIVGVVELQTQRYERTGELAYHVHCVWVGRHPHSTWAMSTEWVQQQWDECMNTEVYNATNNTINNAKSASTNIERIKKSAVGYLGKYMSKGKAALKSLNPQLKPTDCPSSWYICTKELRSKVHSETRVFFGDRATAIYDFLQDNADLYLSFHRRIYWHISETEKICVGWYGFLKIPFSELLKLVFPPPT
jgi:hypothetical protein